MVKSKKLTSFIGCKKGTQFKVTRNTNGHNYGIGTIITLMKDIENHATSISELQTDFPGGNCLSIVDVELYSKMSIADMREEIDCLQKEINNYNNKIQMCLDNGVEQYDEEFFKVLQILESYENKKLSKATRAAQIVKLLNE